VKIKQKIFLKDKISKRFTVINLLKNLKNYGSRHFQKQLIFNHMKSLVDQILSAKQQNPDADISNLEQKIDQLVYKLYDLTEEEIKIIEGGKWK